MTENVAQNGAFLEKRKKTEWGGKGVFKPCERVFVADEIGDDFAVKTPNSRCLIVQITLVLYFYKCKFINL